MDKLSLILWFGIIAVVGRAVADPCTETLRFLERPEWRTEDSVADYDAYYDESSPGIVTLCDKDTIYEGDWYRLATSGDKRLPERCIPQGVCGTQFTISINGSHPTDDTVVTRRLCMHVDGACCSLDNWDETVNIKRCPSPSGYFYIYQLKNPPFCHSGYCVEDFDSITTSTTSTTSTTTSNPTCTSPSTVEDPMRPGQCMAIYPEISSVTIDGPYLEDNKVAIYCQIAHSSQDVDNRQVFWVVFHFQGEPPYDTVGIKTTATNLRVKLPQAQLQGQLGKTVSCRAQSAWSFSETTKSSLTSSTNDYWLGVQMPNGRTDIVLSEGDPLTTSIMPQSTLPVTCPSTPCSISLRLISDDPGVKFGSVCDYFIFRRDWSQANKLAIGTGSIKIKAKRSPVFTGSRSFLLQFEEFQFGPGSIWNDYTVPTITVTYHDSRYGLCTAQLDTAITTFDKREYVLPAKGEFILMRSSADRIYEVQIRTMTSVNCPGGRPCICGVAIRERNRVFGLTMCSSDYKVGSPTRAAIFQYGKDLKEGYSVTRNGPGTRFSFNLASGAHVIADVKGHGLDVYVFAIGEEYGRTSGLCGLYNDNHLDDPNPLTLSNADNYRVAKGSSFFDKEPLAEMLSGDLDLEYCTCDGSESKEIICGRDGIIDPANHYGVPGLEGANGVTTPGYQVTPLHKIPTGTSGSTYDDGDMVLDEEEDAFDYGYTYEPPAIPTSWPTAGGLTEQTARQHCQSTLESLAFFSSCSGIVGAQGQNGVINKCISAIQRTDELSVAQTVLSGYEHECVFDASTSENVTKNPGNGILDKMCPDSCSNHGNCNNMVCTCDPGYTGSDCSVRATQPPTLHRIIGGSICDIQAQPCRQVNILLSNVTDSGSLSCRVTFLSSIGSVLTATTPVHSVSATLRTKTEVTCNLPLSPLLDVSAGPLDHPHHLWRIQVTNDGSSFSDHLNYKLWDSKCFMCGTDGSCQPKSGRTCLVDGRCYSEFEENPTQGCTRCDPDISTTAFSSVPSNKAPSLEGPGVFYKTRGEKLGVQLRSSDPDGQTTFVYNLHQPPQLAGVTVTPGGLLTVSSDSNVTFTVKVSDTCAAADIEPLRVYTVDCGCQAARECVDGMTPMTSHPYMCICQDETCTQDLSVCMAALCPGGVTSVRTNSGLHELTCTTNTLENRCSEGGARYGSFSEWGDCTKPCDYGYRQRERECISSGCLGQKDVQKELCNAHNCEESEDEKRRGVLVRATVKYGITIDKILLMEGEILEIIRDHINILCVEFRTDCCGSDVWLNPQLSYNFVPPEAIRQASSFPRPDYDSLTITFKILAWIPRDSGKMHCGSSRRRKRAADVPIGDRNVPPHVIEKAITACVAQLDQLGLVVRGVDKPPPITEEPDKKFPLVPVVASVCGFLVVLGAVVAIVMCCKKKQQRAREKYLAKRKSSVMPHPHDNSYISRQPPDVIPSSRDSKVASWATTWDPYNRDSGIYDNIGNDGTEVKDEEVQEKYDMIPADDVQESIVDYDHIMASNYQRLTLDVDRLTVNTNYANAAYATLQEQQQQQQQQQQ